MKKIKFFSKQTAWVFTVSVAVSTVVFGLVSESNHRQQMDYADLADKDLLSHQHKVEVWKDPNCGCCTEWVKHMEDNGFQVVVHNTGNREARDELGMPQKYGACHTAKVDGYVIEGHTPATDIRRLLKEKPEALGLATPGMPLGSPGMDGEMYQNRKHPYDVLLVAKNGSNQIYQSY